MRRVALIAVTMMPLASGMSWAQSTPTAAKAQTLEQQIRDWMSETLGPDVKLSKQLITVKAAGDHYDFTMPLGDGADAPLMTASGTPRSDGRWAIDNMRVPSPATFHITLPMKPSADAPMSRLGRMTYQMKVGQQSGQMTVDPTFATSNTSMSTMEDVEVDTVTAPIKQSTHVDRASTSFVAQPAAAGRINVAIQSSMEGYKLTSELPTAPAPLSVGMGRINLTSNIDNVSRERLVTLVQVIAKFASLMPAQGATPTDEQDESAKAALAGLLPALTDLTTGLSFDESLENTTVAVGDMAGSLRLFRIGFSTRVVDGLLQSSLDLGAEGLALPELGLGTKVELIPTKVSLRPVLSGVPTEALAKMLNSAAAGSNGPAPDDIMALFARGNVTAGLDSLVVDVAGSEMLAQGKVTVASPTDISGTAQISVTNLDQLQARIAADPDLAPSAPAIIFLKGIGRTEQNRMVWDVAYSHGKLMVNNQDMTMLMGGADAQAPQQDATPPTSSPTPSVQEGHRALRRRQ